MLRIFALILAFCAAATLDWGAAANAAQPAATERKLERITIRSVGSGPAVVLIPGLASPAAVYDEAAAHIAGNHRLIFVQVNGFAGSMPGARLDNLLPGAVDELAVWLAASHVKKPAVIGHSMGGLVAMMLARQHPEAAGRLLIVDALPFYGMLLGPAATPDTVRPFAEQMRSGLVSGNTPLALPPHMSNSDAGKAKILAWLKASDPKTVGEALVEDSTTDVRPDLPSLASVPVTVLYAVADPTAKGMADALYQSAYKALPNVRLVPIEKSEHFIMLDQPARFDEEVAAFLR